MKIEIKRQALPNRRNHITQSQLDSLQARTERAQKDLLFRYATGKVGIRQFEAAHFALLEKAHTRAAVLGRQRAGDRRGKTPADEVFGRMAMLHQRQFLRQFTDDVLAGRYTDEEGNPRVKAMAARMKMYTNRLTGTANETFAGSSIGHSFIWKMAAREHCPDCPPLAAGSPYKWDKLPTVPRSGQTKCRTQCKCFLIRDDGIEGFR
jgi:hypothetical protein